MSIAIQRYCYTVRGRSVLLLRRQNPDENIEYWPRPTNKILSAGHFPALFGRPFCIALSANQILSAGPCIVYGRFPAVFVTALSCKARRHWSVPPLSGPTYIVYGRFTALFGRPCCIALSTNQILSAGPCIVYGRFPAAFVTVRSCVGWRHRSFPPLSGPTCIVYGHFPALFGRPFCIALSPNQILSAGPCIVYGRFPAAFVTVRSCVGWRHRSFPRCRDLRV